MRYLTANLLQEYWSEQGVDYLSLDLQSQRKLERKHSKKFSEWNVNRKLTLALKRQGYFNKKGIPLLKARIELYDAIHNGSNKFDLKLYDKFEEAIVEDAENMFFDFADEEFKKHKSVDLIDESEIIKDMKRLLRIRSNILERWILDDLLTHLDSRLAERYTEFFTELRGLNLKKLKNLGGSKSMFKRFSTRNASEERIARLERRIARLEGNK